MFSLYNYVQYVWKDYKKVYSKKPKHGTWIWHNWSTQIVVGIAFLYPKGFEEERFNWKVLLLDYGIQFTDTCMCASIWLQFDMMSVCLTLSICHYTVNLVMMYKPRLVFTLKQKPNFNEKWFQELMDKNY